MSIGAGHSEGVPGYVSFFNLRAGSRLKPHVGNTNARLTVHLGVRIPPSGTVLRVGRENTTWRDGRAFVFDDSFVHSAANDHAHQDRFILLANVWKPEICSVWDCT